MTGGLAAAALLAAGSSSRFGDDKLSAEIGGKTILDAASAHLVACVADRFAAIVSKETARHGPLLQPLGYEIVLNDRAASGMGSSVAAAARWADGINAHYVLIALADMPFVTTAHFDELIDRARSGADGCAYTLCGVRRAAPACFSRAWLSDLLALKGDEGARALLRDAPESGAVEAPAAMLADIDTKADLRDNQR